MRNQFTVIGFIIAVIIVILSVMYHFDVAVMLPRFAIIGSLALIIALLDGAQILEIIAA